MFYAPPHLLIAALLLVGCGTSKADPIRATLGGAVVNITDLDVDVIFESNPYGALANVAVGLFAEHQRRKDHKEQLVYLQRIEHKIDELHKKADHILQRLDKLSEEILTGVREAIAETYYSDLDSEIVLFYTVGELDWARAYKDVYYLARNERRVSKSLEIFKYVEFLRLTANESHGREQALEKLLDVYAKYIEELRAAQHIRASEATRNLVSEVISKSTSESECFAGPAANWIWFSSWESMKYWDAHKRKFSMLTPEEYFRSKNPDIRRMDVRTVHHNATVGMKTIKHLQLTVAPYTKKERQLLNDYLAYQYRTLYEKTDYGKTSSPDVRKKTLERTIRERTKKLKVCLRDDRADRQREINEWLNQSLPPVQELIDHYGEIRGIQSSIEELRTNINFVPEPGNEK